MIGSQGWMADKRSPTFALGTMGAQPVSSLNLRFETRWLRAKIIAFLPASNLSRKVGGRSNHVGSRGFRAAGNAELVLPGRSHVRAQSGKPSWSVFIESYLFNSDKCFAIFP